MDFSKNEDLLTNICMVQIRSVHDLVSIPEFEKVYHTPSSITSSVSSSLKSEGTLHKVRLKLKFPGLSQEDFSKFHKLLVDEYQILIKLDNNDVYEVGSVIYPNKITTSYSKKGHQLNFSTSTPLKPLSFRGNFPEEGINVDGFNYNFDFYLN